MANNVGTLITSPIRPAGTSDIFPTALANELLGGFHQVALLVDRDAIPVERRSKGMICYVEESDRVYQLKGGITNDKWVEFSAGGGGTAGYQGVFNKFTDLVSLGTPKEGWIVTIKSDENNGGARSTYIYYGGAWVRFANIGWTSGSVAPSDKAQLWVDISGAAPEIKYWNGLTWESVAGVMGKTKSIQGFTANNYYAYGEIILMNGLLYTAKASFTSGAAFNANDWNLVAGDMRKSIYDQDYDGVVDRAEFADVAQLALETSLVQSWKPNTAYTAGMQLVYLNEIYTVKNDHTSPATFAADLANLDLTATGHHDKLWDIKGGDSSLGQYYHLSRTEHDLLARFKETAGKLQFDSWNVGDMQKSMYDKNNDGVVDKATTLDGMVATLAEVNYLQGTRSNVQTQIDSLTHGMVFRGFANTYADISTVIPTPTAGDTIIVNADETKAGAKTFYTYGGAGWTYLGPFTTSVRDFTVAPLVLGTETTGILPESMIDPAIARVANTHTHINLPLLETYTQLDADIADAVTKKHTHANQALLDSYTQTNLDLANAVSKMHAHTNMAVLDYFGTDASGNLIWRGSPIQGTGSGGGISDLSAFTTNDLRDSLNKRYVTDADRSNLALLPGFITDMATINTTISNIRGVIPTDASTTNKLISDSTLTTRLANLRVTNMLDVEPMIASSFVMTNSTGTKYTYKSSIRDLIKIQKVVDKAGTVFTDVPGLSFKSLTGTALPDGTVELVPGNLYSTDLKDMPTSFDTGKLLVSNATLMKYELKDIGELTNSKANFTTTIDEYSWSFDSSNNRYMAIVDHELNSHNLIVAFYDAAENYKSMSYRILSENEIMVYTTTAATTKVVVNCSQGAVGNGTGGTGGGSTGVSVTDFIDDTRIREDKTYSSLMITNTLADYAKKATVYTKSESDARFSLKGTEHTHLNILTLNKFTEDLNGNVLFNGNKLLTSMKPFFYQQSWSNENQADLNVILNVNDVYNVQQYTAILESEFTIKNMIPSVDETTDANNMLHLVVSDGTLVVLDAQIAPESTQKYLLGISPNLKIMVRGTFSANYYITAY